MNVLKAVRDGGPGDIAEVEETIRQLTEKIRTAQQQLVLLRTMQCVVPPEDVD